MAQNVRARTKELRAEVERLREERDDWQRVAGERAGALERLRETLSEEAYTGAISRLRRIEERDYERPCR